MFCPLYDINITSKRKNSFPPLILRLHFSCIWFYLLSTFAFHVVSFTFIVVASALAPSWLIYEWHFFSETHNKQKKKTERKHMTIHLVGSNYRLPVRIFRKCMLYEFRLWIRGIYVLGYWIDTVSLIEGETCTLLKRRSTKWATDREKTMCARSHLTVGHFYILIAILQLFIKCWNVSSFAAKSQFDTKADVE